MEEFQEADILWPESTQDPKSFVNWQNYLHFTTSSQNEAMASFSSSASSSSESNCTQESDFSCPDQAEEDSYFFSVNANLSEEKICCDEEWQEADVLWPDQESLTNYHNCKFSRENCSVEDEHPSTKGKARNISSPIDVPKSKTNYFVHLL